MFHNDRAITLNRLILLIFAALGRFCWGRAPVSICRHCGAPGNRRKGRDWNSPPPLFRINASGASTARAGTHRDSPR